MILIYIYFLKISKVGVYLSIYMIISLPLFSSHLI